MNLTFIKDISSFKERAAAKLLTLLGQLTIPKAQSIGQLFGNTLWLIPTPLHQTIKKNIRACFPNLSTREQNQLIKKSFINTLVTALEAGPIWLRPIEHGQKHIKKISGEALLDEALAQKAGVLLILPHLGNWEMTNQYIVGKTKITAMYKPAKIQALEDIVYQARTRAGVTMVPANRVGVSKTYKCLKSGGATIILPDQEPDNGKGTFAPFFGLEALTGGLVPRLIQETKATPLLIFCKRLATDQSKTSINPGGFEICVRKVNKAISDNNLSVATAAMNQSIESAVMECPEQYQWSYKRFKTRPKTNHSQEIVKPFYR